MDTDNEKRGTGIIELSSKRAGSCNESNDEKAHETNEKNDSKRRRLDTDRRTQRIAFPLLATAVGEMPVKEAAEIASEVIREFLAKHKSDQDNGFELIVVDSDEDVLSTLEKQCQAIRDSRFRCVRKLFKGGSNKLEFEEGLECRFVVNETTWRLKPDSTIFSRQINEEIGGHELSTQIKNLYPDPGIIGEAYPVKLPSDSDFFKREGAEWIIYVVSPNMNKSRPNPVPMEKAKRTLKDAYESMLNAFWSIKCGSYEPQRRASEEGKGKSLQKSALEVLMTSAKNPPSGKKPGAFASSKHSSSWNDVLWPYCCHPEEYGEEVYYYDDELVIIWDKFPKAKKHLLIMPRRRIDGILELRKDDVEMLRKIVEKGKEVAERLKREDLKLDFRLGFHAVPSMRQLHMHIVSQDFLGPSLKHKKHWNSFTTEFFKNSDEILMLLERNGKIEFDKHTYEEMLKGEMSCHSCGQVQKNIPQLKRHLGMHWEKRSE